MFHRGTEERAYQDLIEYVQPRKVEAMLKNNGDVEEAMVVGEGLPYRVALIWIKKGFDRTGALTAIDQAVANINNILDQLETRMVGVI